ncbi:EVE domain-containing protein [Candidatus Bealeia paramacronuclearis]|uniref:EVE domain-containing protein n=1 Tax=Candidatus Bealeia paramacronuclearis TaxID=1921001 RepID=A0ABZ2C382_9PROT|nr:EVE domain-containing protein [Candidatus Bealeia paramacronuclearis]
MAYWIIKSEPGSWSWEMQTKAGITHWDGVRNYQAANNLKAMKIGDLCFFYHSVHEKQIVGIVEVVREAERDPTDPTGRFVMVDVKTVKPLLKPVTLDQIKSDPDLRHIALVRQSRLSVIPLDSQSWTHLCALGGV